MNTSLSVTREKRELSKAIKLHLLTCIYRFLQFNNIIHGFGLKSTVRYKIIIWYHNGSPSGKRCGAQYVAGKSRFSRSWEPAENT